MKNYHLFPSAAVAISALSFPALAETLSGFNVDSRAVIALDVNDAAAQEWLPAGWTLTTFPGGPFAGADTLIVMIDQLVAYDAENNLATPPRRRAAVLVHPASETGGDGFQVFVTRSYESEVGGNPYGGAVEAEVSHVQALEDAAGEPRRVRDLWAATSDGGTLTVELDYVTGQLGWSESEAQPYSAVNPDFYRIYRIEQLAELIMSVPLGRAPDGAVAVASTIPELAPLFDGTESLVAAISIPVYVREIYLP